MQNYLYFKCKLNKQCLGTNQVSMHQGYFRELKQFEYNITVFTIYM